METTILTPDGIERAVLHSLMWHETTDFLSLTQGLDGRCFYNEQRGDLFEVLRERYLSGLPLSDVEMVVKDMIRRGHKDYTIFDIFALGENTPAVLDIREHVLTIIDLSLRRRMASKSMKLQQDINDRTQDISRIMATFVEEVMQGMGMAEDRTIRLADTLEALRQRMDDNRQGKVQPGLKTGFERLDRYGGFHPGDLIVIAADSSQGKTSLAINMMVTAARQSQARAVVYSMEMSAMQLAARILSPETKMPASVITYRRLKDNSYNEALAGIEALKPIAEQVFFGDSSAQTLSSIVASIRLHHARFGVNMVVVDYLQIISHEPRWNGKTEEALAETARRLKNLAKELGICVLLLSQLNRDGASQGFNIPSAARLRGSGQINEASDLTMLIYRPEVYGGAYPAPFENEPTHATAMIKVDKDRNGAYGGLGSFLVNFDGATTRFWDKEPQAPSLPLTARETPPTMKEKS